MKKNILLIIAFGLGAILLGLIIYALSTTLFPRRLASVLSGQVAAPAATVKSPFLYNFNSPGTLHEAGKMGDSSSPYWWLNSGGKLIIKDGMGGTVSGLLATLDPWRVAYGHTNPIDTEGGYQPQNVFRLVTRNQWRDFEVETYFKILSHHVSLSPNRNESNGLLLMSRYKDGNNLYYAGIRTDGQAVIKKKRNGVYTTLAISKIFPGTYNSVTAPNLLALDSWIGIKSRVITNADGTVTLTLFMDEGRTGTWREILRVTDDNKRFGPVISGSGYVGIRTDFMDVLFDDFKVVSSLGS